MDASNVTVAKSHEHSQTILIMKSLAAFIVVLCLTHSHAMLIPDRSKFALEASNSTGFSKLVASAGISASGQTFLSGNRRQQLLLEDAFTTHRAVSAHESATGKQHLSVSNLQKLEKVPDKVSDSSTLILVKPTASDKVSASSEQFLSVEDLKQLEASDEHRVASVQESATGKPFYSAIDLPKLQTIDTKVHIATSELSPSGNPFLRDIKTLQAEASLFESQHSQTSTNFDGWPFTPMQIKGSCYGENILADCRASKLQMLCDHPSHNDGHPSPHGKVVFDFFLDAHILAFSILLALFVAFSEFLRSSMVDRASSLIFRVVTSVLPYPIGHSLASAYSCSGSASDISVSASSTILQYLRCFVQRRGSHVKKGTGCISHANVHFSFNAPQFCRCLTFMFSSYIGHEGASWAHP